MHSRYHTLLTACAAVIATTTAASGATLSSVASAAPTYPVILASSHGATAVKADVKTDIEAQTLIDQSVENFQDETVGDIESVIIGPSGNIRAVVIGVGGFLGMGERLVALDWRDLEISDNGEKVRVNATAEQLKAMPAYTYDRAERRGTAFEDERYAAAADRAERRNAERTAEDRPERDLKESVAIDKIMDSRGNIKTSEVIGMEVVNARGEVVGDIEELLLSGDGKLTAVLGAGGVLGIGETQLLVDWSRLEVRKQGDQAQIRTVLSNEDLQKLPQNDASRR